MGGVEGEGPDCVKGVGVDGGGGGEIEREKGE